MENTKQHEMKKVGSSKVSQSLLLEKIGVAIIGYGGMGRIYADLIRKSKTAELLYVVGTNKEKLEKFVSENCEKCKGVTNIEEVMKDDKVKAVIIASPSDTHYDYIMKSLLSRRSVLCEKPLNCDIEKTKKCYATAKECGVTLLTAFNRRFDCSFSQLKKNLEEKLVGQVPEIIKITSRDPDTEDKPQENSHPIWDSLSHDFDMANWLVDGQDVEQVYCVQPSPKTIVAVIKFVNGTIVTIDWAKGINYGYDQRVEVHCSDGMMQVENEPISLVQVYDNKGIKSEKLKPFFQERYPKAYERQVEHFLQCVLNPTTKPLITDEQVIAGSKIAHMALDSLKKPNDKFMSIKKPNIDESLDCTHGKKIDSDHVGVCLVGAGRMGKLRANLIEKESRCKLLWIVDVDEMEGKKLAEKHKCKFTKEITEALSDKNVDAVWISVTTSQHMETIKECAKFKKHIYCEKPISYESKEVEEAFQIAKQNDIMLLCGWNKRFDSQYGKVFQMVNDENSGAGKPNVICIHNGDHPTLPNKTIIDIGCIFHDFMIHEIDLSVWITGQFPSSIYAVGTTFQEELKKAGVYDSGVMVMTFPDGSVSLATGRRNSPFGYDQRLEILTKKGALIKADNVPVSGFVSSGLGTEGSVYSKIPHSFTDRYDKAFFNEVTHLADVLIDGCTPLAPYKECQYSAYISDLAMKSNSQKKAILIN